MMMATTQPRRSVSGTSDDKGNAWLLARRLELSEPDSLTLDLPRQPLGGCVAGE